MCDKRQSGWVCEVTCIPWGRVVNFESIHTVSCQMQPAIIHKSQIGDTPANLPALTRIRYGIQVLVDEKERRETHRLSLGRWLNFAKADTELLQNWITCCGEHHGRICTPGVWPTESRITFRVIDVKRRCLVQAPSSCTYFALSYVWGDYRKVKHLKLTKETAAWMYDENAFSEDNPSIPKTIKDAITLVSELGENYIWIDALCIQQDDKSDFEIQIPYMDKIYGCAKCTIVAGSGSDAWAGLTGAGHNPEPRAGRQHCATIQDLELITIQQHYRHWLIRSVWDTRGWTFQEKALSKRRLIFTDEQVFFHAKKYSGMKIPFLKSGINALLFKNRDIDIYVGDVHVIYQMMLTHFTSRSFGFQGDILNAFRGLENLLQHQVEPRSIVSFSSGFIWGLPVSAFDWAILWTSSYHYPARRRSLFPSWSWAGWNYESVHIMARIRFPDLECTSRELAWYRRHSASSTSLPINSSGLGDLGDLPPGSDEILRSQWKGKESSVDIRQPDILGGTIEHMLRFWTSGLRLPVDYSGSQYKLNSDAPTYPDQGNEVMAIRDPLTDDQIAKINLDVKWRASQPRNLDFIILSRCKKGEYTGDGGLFVMLVEWIHGIAYRVQVLAKPIPEDIWVRLKPECKLITLG